MRTTLSSLATFGALLTAASAGATELVVNGDFENPLLGEGWIQGGSSGVVFGPADNPGLSGIAGNFVWLGGYTSAADSLSQVIDFGFDMPPEATAVLTFDYVINPVDLTGYDFFSVELGGTILATYDLGDDARQGYYTDVLQLSFDLTSYVGTGEQTLTLSANIDDLYHSSIFIDNVSVQLSLVPEPSTYALGVGVVALGAAWVMRRRRQHPEV